jgi:hypothetical protein
MSSNVINQMPFLRTSRDFPEEIQDLTLELNKAYIDTANTVNNRIIGIFPRNRPAITGESWFFMNQRQQTLREIYPITSTSAIPHNLNKIYNTIPYFTRMWGQYTNGTNWYGLIPASSTAISGQISFYLDATNINFVSGAGAPSLTSGVVILEWISNV